jgi:hypothetical protein
VAMTTPSLNERFKNWKELILISVKTADTFALIPTAGWPALTAFSAYSICTNFPDGLKVVNENEYLSDIFLNKVTIEKSLEQVHLLIQAVWSCF